MENHGHNNLHYSDNHFVANEGTLHEGNPVTFPDSQERYHRGEGLAQVESFAPILTRLDSMEQKLENLSKLEGILEAVKGTNHLYQELHGKMEKMVEEQSQTAQATHTEISELVARHRQGSQDIIEVIRDVSSCIRVENREVNDDPPQGATETAMVAGTEMPGPSSGTALQPKDTNIDENHDDQPSQITPEDYIEDQLETLKEIFERKVGEKRLKYKTAGLALQSKMAEKDLNKNNTIRTEYTWFDKFLFEKGYVAKTKKRDDKKTIVNSYRKVADPDFDIDNGLTHFNSVYRNDIKPLEEDAALAKINGKEVDYKKIWEFRLEQIKKNKEYYHQ
ncbi:hypothetical protein PSENEW3_00003062 [Picochlorum sp. SENEW3]|nr:hypothetical protein PSENEW3_00003062 [Picochlorum sp. SENEW3]